MAIARRIVDLTGAAEACYLRVSIDKEPNGPHLVWVVMRIARITCLALLLLVAACVAPARSQPIADPTSPTPSSADNRAPDALYVRQSGNGSPSYITVIDARSGNVIRALPDGIMSPDRQTVYVTESLDGATQTRVRAIDAASGEQRRAFMIGGDYIAVPGQDGPGGLSGDGRYLVLQHSPIKINGDWVYGFVALDTSSGTVAGRAEFRGAAQYGLFGIAPDARTLFLNEFGGGVTRLRAYDLATTALQPVSAADWDGTTGGVRGGPILSADGKRVTWLDTGSASGSFIRTMDLVTKRVVQSVLPETQNSTDFEKALLWSLVTSRDGTLLYAVNPAVGVIDEFDVVTARLRRTHTITVSRTSGTILDAVVALVIHPAAAKRYVRGGAVLSPDGRTLYAAGTKGIAVVDTASLESRATWLTSDSFDSFTLSPDGARIYGISDQTGKIVAVQTSDGGALGDFRTGAYPGMIVRIDLAAALGNPNALVAPAPCGAYAAPDPSVAAEIQHLKTSAMVVEVTSPCTVKVTIVGGSGTLLPFVGRTVILRATSVTTFATAAEGDMAAFGKMALKPNDAFTLSFDSRAFPDGTYPLNFMDR